VERLGLRQCGAFLLFVPRFSVHPQVNRKTRNKESSHTLSKGAI
jgi:hypothetical protein